jgi:hypothetical protein
MKKNTAKFHLTTNKIRRGFTLLEAVIALALWLLLSAGVFLVWQHSASSSEVLFARQNAFENARISMDALIMNLQMAHRIRIVNNVHGFRRLDLQPRQGPNPYYQFHFEMAAAQLNLGFVANADNRPHDFSRGNEFASNIAEIKMEYDCENKIMNITIKTDCNEPIILQGSVDVRYKYVVVN